MFWIKAEEMRPPVGSLVLACGKKGSIFIARVDKYQYEQYGYGYANGDFRSFLWWQPLPEIPAELRRKMADVAEVVRCKDCKYWLEEKEYCTHKKCKDGTFMAVKAEADHFCGYGERKE